MVRLVSVGYACVARQHHVQDFPQGPIVMLLPTFANVPHRLVLVPHPNHVIVQLTVVLVLASVAQPAPV